MRISNVPPGRLCLLLNEPVRVERVGQGSVTIERLRASEATGWGTSRRLEIAGDAPVILIPCLDWEEL